MPVGAIIGGAVLGVVSGGIQASATSDAASKAASLQSASSAAALDYAKQKDTQERSDTIAAQNTNYAQWKAGVDQQYRQYVARQQATAPYRAMGTGAGNSLAGLLHVTPGAVSAPAPPPVYPPPPTYTTVPPAPAPGLGTPAPAPVGAK